MACWSKVRKQIDGCKPISGAIACAISQAGTKVAVTAPRPISSLRNSNVASMDPGILAEPRSSPIAFAFACLSPVNSNADHFTVIQDEMRGQAAGDGGDIILKFLRCEGLVLDVTRLGAVSCAPHVFCRLHCSGYCAKVNAI
jgi:hypothetical protein